MNRQLILYLLVGLTAVATARSARGQQLLVNVTPVQIEEALQLASDEKAARKFLQSYVVQRHSGIGTGPLLGYFSTPFSRIVLAALAARKEGKDFASSDVSPELLVPELHVFVLSQTAAYDPVPARMEAVVIASRTSNDADAIVRPVRAVPASRQDYLLYGVTAGDGSTVAIFPLSAIGAGKNIRVIFSHVVRGSSAITNCKECAVPIGIARLR